ncbi:hypothetical protein BC829DRAFT_293828 [Chytridium lagenaria]|nr:hypothetical protein BC829DRAFT_293828 [Chytridium lagenaria]
MKKRLTHELISMMLSLGLFVQANDVNFAIGLKGSLKGRTCFETFLTTKAEGYIMGDLFRCMSGGAHTAASISLLTICYAENCLQSEVYQTEGIRDIINSAEIEVKRIGGCLPPQTPTATTSTIEEGFPAVFDLVGEPPNFFSLDMAQLVMLIGTDARLRDLLALSEKYYRMAYVIMRELKLESSFMCQSAWAYYRELLHFCGNAKAAYKLLDPVLNGYLDVRSFKQYAWGDAILYATDSMDLRTASLREREFWHMTSGPKKSFHVVLENEVDDVVEENLAISEGIPEGCCQPLPAMLVRDSFVYLLLFRVARVAVRVEDGFRKMSGYLREQSNAQREDNVEMSCAVRVFKSHMERTIKKHGLELENIAAELAELLKGSITFFPSMKAMLIYRTVTAWRIWSLYSTLRCKWISLRVRGTVGADEASSIAALDHGACK